MCVLFSPLRWAVFVLLQFASLEKTLTAYTVLMSYIGTKKINVVVAERLTIWNQKWCCQTGTDSLVCIHKWFWFRLMFWTDQTAGTIERARMDGTNRRVVVAGLVWPNEIAVDRLARYDQTISFFLSLKRLVYCFIATVKKKLCCFWVKLSRRR